MAGYLAMAMRPLRGCPATAARPSPIPSSLIPMRHLRLIQIAHRHPPTRGESERPGGVQGSHGEAYSSRTRLFPLSAERKNGRFAAAEG